MSQKSDLASFNTVARSFDVNALGVGTIKAPSGRQRGTECQKLHDRHSFSCISANGSHFDVVWCDGDVPTAQE